MTHKEYNGYTNYETWVIALWLDNEVGAQSYWLSEARNAITQYGDNGTAAASHLADTLKEILRR